MTDLLPQNATAFERAASLTMDASTRVSPAIGALRTAKRVAPPDSALPFLILEYGLGPVSAYVPDQRDLLATGIDWQRVRGTPDAVARGLDWVGYSATIEEAPTNRRRWHLFQLGLDRLRDAEDPDLEQIEGITALSVAVRSQFWRGFNGYDVREMEWSRRRYSAARWSSSSGVRLRDGGAKWSFGTDREFVRSLSRGTLVALGVWQDLPDPDLIGWGLPVFDSYVDSTVGWGSFTWDGTTASWAEYGQTARQNVIASGLANRPVWLQFRDAANAVLGYRRARVARPVVQDPNGPYMVANVRYAPATLGTSFYVEALTDFGNGAGATAANCRLIWDALPTDPARPGLQWAEPSEVSAGTSAGTYVAPIEFGETVRHRLRILLTF